ncbi:MAG: hypothetical protein SFY80_17320 [Verrucomicrobiota bacterium]|nr:hypothetical protein [Verrucomicrobiota bacterium]
MNATPPPVAALREEWTNTEGDHFIREGDFYSFKSADGLRGIKLWVPPVGEVRGVILHGNPGGGFGGDTRNKTSQRDILEFAARQGLGVAGVNGFPGRQIYRDLGLVILRAFTGWGSHGSHPELAQVPLLVTGGSNAGVTSFGMLCQSPERIIAITPNCGPVYTGDITEAVRQVPAWMHVGSQDPLIPVGLENTEALFAEQGKNPLPWAWDAEIKGHENGSTDHADMAYWESIVRVRVPAAPAPTGSTLLNPVDLKTGWYVDHRSWDHTIARVFPAAELAAQTVEPGRYGWLPDEGMARIYQSLATRARHLILSYVEDKQLKSGPTSGVYLASGANRIYAPGETVKIKVEFTPMMWGIERADVFDRDRKLGEIDFKQGNTFEFKVDGSQILYALHVRAIATRFKIERVSNPLLFIVKEPSLSAKIDAQFAAVSLENKLLPRAKANSDFQPVTGAVIARNEITANRLAALPIEALATPNPFISGKVQPFWSKLAQQISPVVVNQRSKPNEDNNRQVLPPLQKTESPLPKLQAQAAYNAQGMYFLFTVDGEDWSRTSANPLDKMVDFHLASQSLNTIQKGDVATMFAMPAANALLRSALQMQVHLDDAASKNIHLNDWGTWDCVNTEIPVNDANEATGIWSNLVVSSTTRSLELFLPWRMVGNPGFAGPAPAGSSFAMVLGYNHDSEKLVWPLGIDPWQQAIRDLNAVEKVWGELVLMR